MERAVSNEKNSSSRSEIIPVIVLSITGIVIIYLCELVDLVFVRISVHAWTIIRLLFCIVFSFVTKPFLWSKQYYEINANDNHSRKRIWVFILLIGSVIFRIINEAWIAGIDQLDFEFSFIRVLLIAETLIGAAYEELLFKAGFFRIFEHYRLPLWFSVILATVIFTILHLGQQEYLINYFTVIAFFQIFSLIMFRLYPNLIFFCFVHAGWNIMNAFIK